MAIDRVVLVHGAFADGYCWAKVIPLLTARDLDVIAVQSPLTSLADDVAAVRRIVEQHETPVVLVGHAWGGVVITEAGSHPRVNGLVYVAAGAPEAGQSFDGWRKDYDPEPGAAEIKPYGDGYVALTREGARKHLAQDLSQDEADAVYAMQGPLAVRCYSDPICRPAWAAKPCWYIVAAQDHTIPAQLQRDSAARMNAETLVLESSHMPMLSHPRAVADVIAAAAAAL
ncbi:alpha/beta hydrolase [Caulobacter sp. 1776]|uniref:alpha/beta fold hydrolase n=1 Tax=Caulobacter sp. 1776 TaxID=3156420 RepID=UPI003393211F